ncbi:MAG TPA: TerB family tellurite resistance protein [Polyangiaceae bacterium]|jgi:hypothetical protein
MFDALARDERLLLLRFVCAFAWTDLEVQEAERAFVHRLMDRLQLSVEDRAEVETWLHVAPAPGSLDPKAVPAAHRRTFVEAVRAMITSTAMSTPKSACSSNA